MHFLNLVIISILLFNKVSGDSIKPEFEQYLEDDPQLRQFTELYKTYKIGAAFVAYGGAIFAPIDKAFDKKPLRNKNNDILIPSQLTSKNFVDLRLAPKTLETFAGLPLRLTKFLNPVGNAYEYYINNAKILGAAIEFRKGKAIHQVFKIDELIEPVVYSDSRSLTAYELINEPTAIDELRVGLHNVVTFGTRINKTGEAHWFNDEHAHSTYFVPIDSLDMFADSRIVRMHVIPNITLFTRTLSNLSYVSAATHYNLDRHQFDLCVNLTFDRERFFNTYDYNENDDYEGKKYYVKAHIERHDDLIEKWSDGLIPGITFSEIVLPNIPVKNGVVHFIKYPLASTSLTVYDSLSELSKIQLSRFYTFLRKYGEVYGSLVQPGQKTIFAFTNDAYDRVAYLLESYNSTLQKEIIQLHISKQFKLNSNEMRIGEFKNLESDSRIYNDLHATNEDIFNQSVLYVEGGNVKARAIEANILCSDGNINIIDRVLGVDYQTVMEKLQSDPFLWRTFNASTMKRNVWGDTWALKLNETRNNAKFTFFAPSENAWKNLKENHPSYYKQLNEGFYMRNTIRIMDRHLILNEAFSTEDLVKRNEIKTLTGEIKIYSEGAKIFLEWEGIHAHIERSNIRAINGIIHAIDKILFKETDMKVSETEARYSSSTIISINNLLIYLTVLITISYNRFI